MGAEISMVMSWSLREVASAVGAQLHQAEGREDAALHGLFTDTREPRAGALFVALRGERFDAHSFVGQAQAAGAAAAVVDRVGLEACQGAAPGLPLLAVDDTLRALGDLAAAMRVRHNRPVVGITGSNGKTTTKELIAALLGSRGLVHKTAGNLNNLIGVPLTLLSWPSDAWAGVIEMGMNALGEIARLTEIAAPNVGVLTQIGTAHVGPVGGIAAVAQAKSELVASMPPDAVAVLPGDCAWVERVTMPLLRGRRCLRFGETTDCDVQLVGRRAGVGVRGSDAQPALGQEVELRVGGEPLRFWLPLAGHHNARNAAAAVAAAWACGIALADMPASLESVRLPHGRLALRVMPRQRLHVLDDSYNANPTSTEAALRVLIDQAGDGRSIAVLGDMLELGADAPRLHREVGETAARLGVSLVIGVGSFAADLVAGAQAGGIQAEGCLDAQAVMRLLPGRVQAGDWLLVKGSRSMRMERIVEALEEGER